MRELDVLVACHVCLPIDDALTAIDTTVRGGMGLLIRQCLGGDNLGYARPVIRDLKGLAEAEPDALRAVSYGMAKVINPHPLLGSLSGRLGATVGMKTFGAYGVCTPDNVPLIQLDTFESIVFDKLGKVKEVPGYGVYPLTAGQLERGRIVGCAFNETPIELDAATNGMFSIRAVRWLAGRELD